MLPSAAIHMFRDFAAASLSGLFRGCIQQHGVRSSFGISAYFILFSFALFVQEIHMDYLIGRFPCIAVYRSLGRRFPVLVITRYRWVFTNNFTSTRKQSLSNCPRITCTVFSPKDHCFCKERLSVFSFLIRMPVAVSVFFVYGPYDIAISFGYTWVCLFFLCSHQLYHLYFN